MKKNSTPEALTESAVESSMTKNLFRTLAVVMCTAGFAHAQDFQQDTHVVREEQWRNGSESGFDQTSCDNQGTCTRRYQSSFNTNEVHTYFEQNTFFQPNSFFARFRRR